MPSTPEQREQWRLQREKHKEQRHEYAKKNYQLNKESELERTKEWRELNPDKVRELNRNSETKRLMTIICDVCGCNSSQKHLHRHKQSNKCVRLNTEQNNN